MLHTPLKVRNPAVRLTLKKEEKGRKKLTYFMFLELGENPDMMLLRQYYFQCVTLFYLNLHCTCNSRKCCLLANPVDQYFKSKVCSNSLPWNAVFVRGIVLILEKGIFFLNVFRKFVVNFFFLSRR
jgi:hypothetical protein